MPRKVGITKVISYPRKDSTKKGKSSGKSIPRNVAAMKCKNPSVQVMKKFFLSQLFHIYSCFMELLNQIVREKCYAVFQNDVGHERYHLC